LLAFAGRAAARLPEEAHAVAEAEDFKELARLVAGVEAKMALFRAEFERQADRMQATLAEIHALSAAHLETMEKLGGRFSDHD
jgi:hypothetical protein